MPRGRAGLVIVPPDEVRRAVYPGGGCYGTRYTRGRAVARAAEHFGVARRTIRRALERGLPLHYGRRCITRDEWEAYEVARGVRAGSAADNCRSTPVPRAIAKVSARRRLESRDKSRRIRLKVSPSRRRRADKCRRRT